MKQIFVFLLLCYSFTVKAQTDSLILNRLKSHVVFLASDSLLGRATGSEAEKVANEYVRNQFESIKGKTKIKTIHYRINDTLNSEMVTCFVDNHSKYTIVIGAHIDHLGMGGTFSKSVGKWEVHNGADDNASGVALLIELQRLLCQHKLAVNVLFIPFTGHEMGTFGSRYIAENWQKKWRQPAAVLNFDMMGRLAVSNPTLYVSNNELGDSLFQSSEKMGCFYTDNKRIELLDTKHFLKFGIPCITFTTGIHDDYHKTSDDWQYINFSGLKNELDYFKNWLLNPANLNAVTAPATKMD